jgi:RHS repeat-associated protein
VSVQTGEVYSATTYYNGFNRPAEIRIMGLFSDTYNSIVYAPDGFKFAYMNGQSAQSYVAPLAAGVQAVYTAATPAPPAYWRHSDWLGSSRIASTPSQTVYYDASYAPFGENYNETGTTDRSFTGQTQDTTPGLYDFLFREQSPVQGRWLAPDPAGLAAVNLTNPQTWNRYAYVANNPLNAIDPLGMDMTEVCPPWIADCTGSSGGGGGGWGPGLLQCGVDPFCIAHGGVGPFDDPIARGGSYETATYEAGGTYDVPEEAAAEQARLQRIMAAFEQAREAAWEKRQQQALDQCITSGVCALIALVGPVGEGFQFDPHDGLLQLLNAGDFILNDHTGFEHGGITGWPNMDYRSRNGTFGPGSLQVDVGSLGGYFDVDRFNPNQGVFSLLGHVFLEAIPHWWRGY